MKILIVDDTADNILLFKTILINSGLSDVVTFSTAKEAITFLENSSRLNLDPADLILIDFMMPEINGVEACQIIKQKNEWKDIPIIMITALNDLGLLESAFRAGAIDFITKPVKKIEMLARVRSALSLKEAVDQRKARETMLEQKNRALQKAVHEITALRNFIPICASCKKIKNFDGIWQQLESYFLEHSDVKFSHGMCETCLADYMKKVDKVS